MKKINTYTCISTCELDRISWYLWSHFKKNKTTITMIIHNYIKLHNIYTSNNCINRIICRIKHNSGTNVVLYQIEPLSNYINKKILRLTNSRSYKMPFMWLATAWFWSMTYHYRNYGTLICFYLSYRS